MVIDATDVVLISAYNLQAVGHFGQREERGGGKTPLGGCGCISLRIHASRKTRRGLVFLSYDASNHSTEYFGESGVIGKLFIFAVLTVAPCGNRSIELT